MTNTKQVVTDTGNASTMRGILQSIAIARIRCREFARLRKSDEAQQALARARELYAELLSTADLENPVHRSIVRNRRVDLGMMVAEVESCRLKCEVDKVRRARRKTGA